jgi:hypothetical protein
MKISLKLRRLLASASVAAALVALSLPSSVAAGTWGWEGFVGVHPNQGNGQCVGGYAAWSSCGPWNYWYQVNAADECLSNGYCGGEVHSGFENNSVIRGSYLLAGDSKIIYCQDVSMCGVYNKSETTFCTWCSINASYYDAYVWFRGYA